MVPPPSQNTVGISKQITLIILYYNSSTLVTLKVIDAPILVINIFYLTVIFKFFNFDFQIFLLFVREMSASVTSYIV